MKVILCLALGLALLSGGALLWKATTSASRQQTAADTKRAKYERILRDYYREDIESAKKQGKKEVILPGGIALPTPELSLEELLRDYGLLRVKVIDKETTVYVLVPEIPSADIETWYKVEILETLHQQGKVSDESPPFELPSRFLPLLPSESLLVEQGGVINVDGVAVVREVSTEGVVYIPKEEYLIVGYLDYGGKLIRPSSGRASVFHVINKRLKSGQKEHRLVRDIEERYGGDLDLLRSDMRLRQGRGK
ncbi:MAG: hypothetical protein L0226_05180 [Acidobacteria bacterium]|nr:hypothetical protein [Acidobacteriota bacterium]